MAEAAPAVALMFDDAGLGEQLRSALQERGARIVHEGPMAGLSRELLSSVNADVLVVNLEEDDDDALDRLDQSLEGDRPRVVFNEANASRRLEGWDRARWARHLAMKVLAIGDADPPRPPAPAELAMAAPAAAAIVAAEVEAVAAGATGDDGYQEIDEEARQTAVSETLAAELEALLASEAPADEVGDFGPGLNYAAGEGVDLHDGTFEDGHGDRQVDTAVAVVADANLEKESIVLDVTAAASPLIEPPERAAFQLDHLQLAPVGDDVPASVVHEVAGPAAAESAVTTSATVPRVSDSWTLLDDDTSAAAPTERVDPAEFGIQKLSAADYLAPDAGDEIESPILPGLSLELVSIEEAIAPQHFESSHEMVLDLPGTLLRGLVVLGATTESTASVGEFLAALPADLRATVLHTQHLAGRPANGLVDYFASQCALPVRLAVPGLRARIGEVIVVPSDHQVTLRRDGSLDLQKVEAGAAHAPSIDISFSQAAAVFGGDVVAIVFAGRSTDAVAGSQAVHDRGGQVWVEASGGAQPADMVSGVLAERVSHFAGMPRELAARLAEQLSEGQP